MIGSFEADDTLLHAFFLCGYEKFGSYFISEITMGV